MKKGLVWALAILLVLGGVAFGVFGFFLPWYHAQSSMPVGGTLTLTEQPDGSVCLNWPVADRADYYLVELVRPGEEEEVLFSDYAKSGNSYTLDDLPSDEELVIRVSSVVDYGKNGKMRLGEQPLEVKRIFAAPRIKDLEWLADAQADTVTIDFKMTQGDKIRVYQKKNDGSCVTLKTVSDVRTQITFGQNGDIPVPEYGETVMLAFDAYREEKGLVYYGAISQEITIVREDLLDRELEVTLKDEGRNVVTLAWNETKGASYQIYMQEKGEEAWEILADIPAGGKRSFTTPHLPVMRELSFQVVAMGGQTMVESDYAAISNEVTFQTAESPIYATVWPVKNLKTYADAAMTEEVGSVKAAAAYCVLDEVEGAFLVSVDGREVYIDSNYCMINLPEYFGDLCSYQITNSYSSIYMIHEYGIPKVTDVITSGYEKVRMENGGYLVPILYRTAQKLAVAAKAAREQGYRLKIYDAYRPNKATVQIYNLTESILDEPLPKKTFKGGVMYDLPKLPEKENEEDPDPIMTYRVVMTNNGSWQLSAFLAKGASLHNVGVAVDLTLENLADGKELAMQTAMHDLSFYSVISRNNGNAKLLNTIMTSAGMGGLVSEWWHFQDNELRNELNPPVVWEGVSPECWMKDDYGWRYRRYNGSYFTDGEHDIYGTVYRFDEFGYVMEN